jgi:hypothetical protein
MRHVQCLSQDILLRHVPCCFYLHPEDTSDAMTHGAMAGCRTCTVHHIVSVVGRSNPGDAWSTVSLHQEDRTTNQSAHTPCARPTPTAKKMGQRNGLACSGKQPLFRVVTVGKEVGRGHGLILKRKEEEGRGK